MKRFLGEVNDIKDDLEIDDLLELDGNRVLQNHLNKQKKSAYRF